MRRRTLYLFLTILALATTSCAFTSDGGPDTRVGLSDDDVRGVWLGDSGENITFATDGTYITRNIPTKYFSDFLDTSGFNQYTTDGSGAWQLTANRFDPQGPLDLVDTTFDRVGNSAVSIDFPLDVQCYKGRVVLEFAESVLHKDGLDCKVGKLTPIRR
jgi:hypothetical protein